MLLERVLVQSGVGGGEYRILLHHDLWTSTHVLLTIEVLALMRTATWKDGGHKGGCWATPGTPTRPLSSRSKVSGSLSP